MKEAYIKLILLGFLRSAEFDELWGRGWVPAEKHGELARRTVVTAFDRHDILVLSTAYEEEFAELFEALDNGGAIQRDGDEYSDNWFRLNPNLKNKIVEDLQSKNEANKRVTRLGPSALQRALEKIVLEDGHRNLGPDEEASDFITDKDFQAETGTVPASDRVVLLSHNQITEIEDESDHLFKSLDENWTQPNEPDETSLAVGQVKAGLELVRAGILDLDLFRMSMVAGLRLLIEKYKDHAIGAAAGNLLNIILKNFGVL